MTFDNTLIRNKGDIKTARRYTHDSECLCSEKLVENEESQIEMFSDSEDSFLISDISGKHIVLMKEILPKHIIKMNRGGSQIYKAPWSDMYKMQRDMPSQEILKRMH